MSSITVTNRHDIHNQLYAMEAEVALGVMRSVVGNDLDVHSGLHAIHQVQRETRSTHARIERMYRNIGNITIAK
jgi:hypothetical protein